MSYLFPTYARWDVTPTYASGSTLIDKNGKEYIDLTSGIGVNNLGHRPKAVQKAIEEQLNKFWHVSNLFTIDEQEQCAELLAKGAQMEAVFFANSGAEANEGAMKLARKATGRSKIISFNQSFHGRTFATMAATGQDKIKQGFGQMLETFVHVPYNDFEQFEQQLDEETAGCIVEVVQGEGGVYVGDSAILKKIEKACHEAGALLIIDEVQTGIGRTGKPFAFQHFGLNPDIVTTAKGLGNGFPIGAIIGKNELKEHFGPGTHGSTFGGNPIAIAAAKATLSEVFNESFLEEVIVKGNFAKEMLQSALSDSEIVKDIRGIGLMIGVEIDIEHYKIADLLKDLRTEGVLALSAGENVLRLLPPLTITEEELKKGLEIIVATIKKNKS